MGDGILSSLTRLLTFSITNIFGSLGIVCGNVELCDRANCPISFAQSRKQHSLTYGQHDRDASPDSSLLPT